jgi:hypothetical protein
VAAANLAAAGLRVVVLEKAGFVPARDMTLQARRCACAAWISGVPLPLCAAAMTGWLPAAPALPSGRQHLPPSRAWASLRCLSHLDRNNSLSCVLLLCCDWQEGQAFGCMYEQGGIMTSEDGAVAVLAGATLGGGTRVNWCASFRTPAHVRQAGVWARESGGQAAAPAWVCVWLIRRLQHALPRLGSSVCWQ